MKGLNRMKKKSASPGLRRSGFCSPYSRIGGITSHTARCRFPANNGTRKGVLIRSAARA